MALPKDMQTWARQFCKSRNTSLWKVFESDDMKSIAIKNNIIITAHAVLGDHHIRDIANYVKKPEAYVRRVLK